LGYYYLAFAIVAELIGTSLIKASAGFSKLLPTIGVLASFFIAFYFLSLSLKTIPLNIAYALWSGLGTVATVIISVLLWKEKVTPGSIIGIALIVLGVAVLQFFGPGQGQAVD
jgi:small multidrug resistance pump